jgi:hypothetical protein
LVGGYTAVAAKPRHRFQSALFWTGKGGVRMVRQGLLAQVIDATDAFDDLVLERSELNSTRRVSFWRGSLGEPAKITCQQLSELRKGHVVGDETTTAASKAILRRVASDVAALAYRLEVAPTAALLARHLYENRHLG